MARMIKYGEFDALQLGMPSNSALNQIHGGMLDKSLESNVKPGTPLVYGDVAGVYKPAKSTFTSDNFAGIVVADQGKMNLIYGERSADFLPGQGVNVLTLGYITVEVDDNSGIKEGAKVYILADGSKFTKTDSSNIAINAIFTGDVATIGGVKLAAIKLG